MINLDLCRLMPFCCNDSDIIKCMLFFLYFTPYKESSFRGTIDASYYDSLYKEIEKLLKKNFHVYSEGSLESFKKKLTNNNANGLNIEIHKVLFYCTKASSKDNHPVEAVFRHLRNSIAHGNVYYTKDKNKHWYIFDDYSASGKLSARAILNKKDVIKLKRTINEFMKDYGTTKANIINKISIK